MAKILVDIDKIRTTTGTEVDLENIQASGGSAGLEGSGISYSVNADGDEVYEAGNSSEVIALNINNPQDGDVLSYDAASQTWKAIAGGSAKPPLVVSYLVIAGGGAGARSHNGGGGAGGYRNSYLTELSGGNTPTETPLMLNEMTNYNVTVGAGGAFPAAGNNSEFASIVSLGGGSGADSDAEGSGVHGSGAGSYYGQNGNQQGTVGQGHRGGAGYTGSGHANSSNPYLGGGGGGAGTRGTDAGYHDGGDGGDGLPSGITGVTVYRAAGGGSGGDGWRTAGYWGSGGNGGGGDGGDDSHTATAGVDNTGSGGGAGGSIDNGANLDGEKGGSGVVILRYPAQYTISFGAGLVGTETGDGAEKFAIITAGTGNVSWS